MILITSEGGKILNPLIDSKYKPKQQIYWTSYTIPFQNKATSEHNLDE